MAPFTTYVKRLYCNDVCLQKSGSSFSTRPSLKFATSSKSRLSSSTTVFSRALLRLPLWACRICSMMPSISVMCPAPSPAHGRLAAARRPCHAVPADASPWFQPRHICPGVQVLSLHGGDTLHINLYIVQQLRKIRVRRPFAEQGVTPVRFSIMQSCRYTNAGPQDRRLGNFLLLSAPTDSRRSRRKASPIDKGHLADVLTVIRSATAQRSPGRARLLHKLLRRQAALHPIHPLAIAVWISLPLPGRFNKSRFYNSIST